MLLTEETFDNDARTSSSSFSSSSLVFLFLSTRLLGDQAVSVQSDSIFLLKPPKLSIPLLYSLDLIVVLLALLRFSLNKFKD